MYAVVKLQWHQYIIKKWDKIVVDNVNIEDGKTLNTTDVLLTFDEKGESVQVWTPFVKSAKVSFKVLETKKWDKVKVVKFRRKNRYERNLGFRPLQSTLEVKSIKLDD